MLQGVFLFPRGACSLTEVELHFKWHPLLVIVYRVDILNFGLFDGKHETLLWEVGFLVTGLVLVYMYLLICLLSIFLAYNRVLLVLIMEFFKCHEFQTECMLFV